MKTIDESLKFKIQASRAGIKRCKWSDIYDTPEELIRDMFSDKILTDEDTDTLHVCKGYEYIKSFRKYYEKNGMLTERQVTQLKRLAGEIAYHIYCEDAIKEPSKITEEEYER